VAIEDLHWSDPSSLLALERLVPLAASVPIAFAFTSRLDPDAFVSEVLDRAARSNEVVRVELDELHPGADRELVASLVGASALPPALLQRVLEVGGGNPFFLGELVRSLIDGGALVRSDGEWTLAGDVRPELPPTVDRVLLARIDRLPDVDRAVLTAASVLGRRFSAASLAALLDADPTEAVVRLTAADLVRPEPPDHAFAHVLVQETAYATLLKKRRRELHARAAAAIEAEDARVDEKAAVLGRHHAGAGNDAEALRWFLVAADRAEGLSALLETIDHLDAALPLTDPEGELAASLRLRRGRLRGRTGDHRGARADLDEALRLALARLDRGLEMRCRDEIGFLVAGSADYRESVEHLEHALSIADEIGDAPGRVSALSRLAITWANRLQLDRAKRSADLALETASAAGEDRLVATALDALKQVALELGRFDDLERYGEQIGALYARRNDRWLLQFVEFETGYASIARARLEEGRERLERSLATNRELHDDGNEPLHLAAIGHHHRCRGTLDDAVELGRRACSLARERRHEEWTGWAASELGGTLLLLGAREEAIDVLREGAEAGERSGAELQALRCVGLLVRALARTDMGEVRRLLPAAEARIALITVPEGDRFLLGWDGLVGVAAARLEGGDADRANRAVGRIVEACTTRPWPEAVIDASLVEAAALATLGDAEGALGSARRADEWVRAHPLPAYGWRAAAALATALPDPNEAAQAADRARAAAEALLGTIADASLRRHLEDDVERVLSREATAWA
jgi:tetratricopeptide (TPR) repeat protein